MHLLLAFFVTGVHFIYLFFVFYTWWGCISIKNHE